METNPQDSSNNKKPLLPDADPDSPQFTPEVLDKTVIAIPLLNKIKAEGEDKIYEIIIDLNWSYNGGSQQAEERVRNLINELKKREGGSEGAFINEVKTRYSRQYVFASLRGKLIQELVVLDKQDINPQDKESEKSSKRAIYRIWPDFELKAFTVKSISTVKADAARSSFAALGADITWAVIDSGIEQNHPHFQTHKNIHESYHKDFTAIQQNEESPLSDQLGHGTHVAGIIAGEMKSDNSNLKAIVRHRNEKGEVTYERLGLTTISGMAPKCKLVSLKVLDGNGKGMASSLIVAIEYIQEINGYGRDIKIDGVNMSLGYDFDPEWFACGQSPLCVEVDRLVKSGVVVVAAAGNTGYGYSRTAARNMVAQGLPLSINDPGNSELAITVGSTHRDMPHTYGISYFSSKGPTGDGRLKPDLVAPGEKIISCAAGEKKHKAEEHVNSGGCDYVEDSGTSMAAPHVSGVIAAFLSIRREFRGKPEIVKQIFLSTATDLKRDRYFQGYGLVDLMRAIQSL